MRYSRMYTVTVGPVGTVDYGGGRRRWWWRGRRVGGRQLVERHGRDQTHEERALAVTRRSDLTIRLFT